MIFLKSIKNINIKIKMSVIQVNLNEDQKKRPSAGKKRVKQYKPK